MNEFETSIQIRMLCHILVDAMPKDGLDELCESVTSMHEFYSTRAAEPVQLPAPSQVIPAKITGASERPQFYVVED